MMIVCVLLISFSSPSIWLICSAKEVFDFLIEYIALYMWAIPVKLDAELHPL